MFTWSELRKSEKKFYTNFHSKIKGELHTSECYTQINMVNISINTVNKQVHLLKANIKKLLKSKHWY